MRMPNSANAAGNTFMICSVRRTLPNGDIGTGSWKSSLSQ